MLSFQIIYAQTEIGIKAGYVRGSAIVKLHESKQKGINVNGYTASLIFKAPFESPLHFSPTISYTHRGYGYSADTGKLRMTQNETDYIELSPAVSIDFVNKKKVGFVLGFGPQASIAISGKESRTYLGDSVVTEKMVFGFSNYSVIDVGINGSIAFRFGKRLMLEALGYISVTNIDNVDENFRNIKNRMLSLSLAYFLK